MRKLNYNKLASVILLLAMLIAFIVILLIRGPHSLAFDTLCGFAGSILILIVMNRAKINLKYYLLVNLSIWFHLIGLMYFYNNFQYYDKIIHLISSSFITLIIYDYYVKKQTTKKIFVLLTVIGILTIWEFYEYFIDTIFQLKTQGVFDRLGKVLVSPIDDTMHDLIIGSLSSLFTLYLKK